jgi:hypothetical protein
VLAGGRLDIETEQGAGSTVYLRLPFENDPVGGGIDDYVKDSSLSGG